MPAIASRAQRPPRGRRGTSLVLTTANLEHLRQDNAPLANRLAELGLRAGAQVEIGPAVAGGSRIVSVGTCRYAIDAHTLRLLEVLA